VAIAVRTHRTLELVDDKFYMITCGKAGFQNTRYAPQGDQIGRIFANRAIVFFGQFLENFRSSPNICGQLFLQKKMYAFSPSLFS
jgi:hypothetical protein